MPIPTGPIDLSLELFGGLNTEMSPTDLPEGASPDNQDVIFQPGGVLSRPCLSKIFSNPFTSNPKVLYEKKMLQGNGNPLNLYLDSLGNLRKEDPVNSPGTYSLVTSVTPGAYAKSVNIDGVEYIAFNNGIHGIDIPLQYDGTNIRRVSQEGPAVAPTAADYAASVNISGITTVFAAINVSSGIENGNIVTLTLASAHGYFPGNIISVLGVGAGYNGVVQVLATPDSTSFTYFSATAGLAPVGAAGTAREVTVQVTTATPHQMIAGAQCTIKGTGTAYDNAGSSSVTWAVQAVPTATTFYIVPSFNPVVAGAGGTVQVGGQITIGGHGVAVCFLTDTDYITKPSPTGSWIASGGKQVSITNLPIGPSNVKARIILFTGAGGASYFWILAPVSGANATVINDNTSTSCVIDFSDDALFAEEPADITGGNLFALVTLAPCLGFVSFASRLLAYGEFNKVQTLLNMGFEGGTATVGGTTPLGWSAGAGGALVSSPADFGLAWKITGDGTANPRGQLSQSAYQNYLNNLILDVNTQYTFYCWAKASASGLNGTLVATLSAASTGYSSTATINVNTIPNANGAFVHADFTVVTPATIPSDLTLTIKALNLPNLATVTIDEMMLVFTAQPYRDTEFRCSYAADFESFDGVTGTMGPVDDPNPIRDTAQIRRTLYILTGTAEGQLHQTSDSNGEPGTWEVDPLETNVGGVSANCVIQGANWFMWVADTGVAIAARIFGGGDSRKISREIKTLMSGVNMAAKSTMWAVNVDGDSRAYVGVPSGVNATPSVMAVLDYLELDTAEDISAHGSVHTSFTGKMISTDLARKWTVWNLPMASGAVLARSATTEQFVVGSGGAGFGNAYTLDASKLTDDDYGQMLPYYTTYFFVNHQMEQQLPVGNRNKLYDGFSIFITGVGYLQVTPIVNKLTNALPGLFPASTPWALTSTLADDIEVPGEVSGRRVAFKVSVSPLQGTTDVQFSLTHFGLSIQRHPTQPKTGSNRG